MAEEAIKMFKLLDLPIKMCYIVSGVRMAPEEARNFSGKSKFAAFAAHYRRNL